MENSECEVEQGVSFRTPHSSPTLKLAAQVGIAPTPVRLTGGRTTLIPLSKESAEFGVRSGKTFHSAFRTRRSALQKWSARQDLHLRSLGSRPSMLLLHHALSCPAVVRKRDAKSNHSRVTPQNHGGVLCSLDDRSEPWGRTHRGDWRTRRELHPQPSRRQRGALIVELRVRMVLQIGSGGGSCTRGS